MRIILSLMFLAVLTTNLRSKEPISFAVGGHAPMFIESSDRAVEPNGFDVDVVRAIAKDMGVGYALYPTTFRGVFSTFSAQTQIDAGIASITINSERVGQNYNFTHPYKKSGLSILVRDEPTMDIFGALAKVFLGDLANVWIFFGIFIAVMGVIICYVEDTFKTFGEGAWWTIVTSTTVGYGDYAPQTGLGRFLACIVMIVGICTTGILIGSFSAVLNTQIVTYNINGVEDLKGKQVATMAGTTSVDTLKKVGANVQETKTLNEAILLLEAKRVDALVFDDPQVRYISKENDALTVVGDMFDLQDYGIMIGIDDEPLRRKMNESILRLIENGTMASLEEKWFDK